MAIASCLIPFQLGLPSLSEYPRYATIITSELVQCTSLLIKGKRQPMLPAFSWKQRISLRLSMFWFLLCLVYVYGYSYCYFYQCIPSWFCQLYLAIYQPLSMVPSPDLIQIFFELGSLYSKGFRYGLLFWAGDFGIPSISTTIINILHGMQMILCCCLRMTNAASKANDSAAAVLGYAFIFYRQVLASYDILCCMIFLLLYCICICICIIKYRQQVILTIYIIYIFILIISMEDMISDQQSKINNNKQKYVCQDYSLFITISYIFFKISQGQLTQSLILFPNKYIYNIQHITRQNKMLDDTDVVADKQKPIFMDPNDPNLNHDPNLMQIMSSIHTQEQQIMRILSKYKDVIPEDQNYQEFQIGSGNQLKLKEERKKVFRKKKQVKDQSRISNQVNKTISNPGADVIPPRSHRTLSLNNNNKIQKQLIARERGFQLDHLTNTSNTTNTNNNQIKLPKMITKRQTHKKQQHEIYYQKVDKQYQQKIAKFYQGVKIKNNQNNNANSQLNRISMTERVNKSKPSKDKPMYISNTNKQSRMKQVNIEKYLSGLKDKQKQIDKQDNIFDDQEYRLAQNTQRIAQPLPYHPYSYNHNHQMVKQAGPNKKNTNNNKIQYSKISNAKDYDDDDADEPTSVPMSYYIREFNNKLKQQSKQEINYLYFSKADENGSNKEWAQQILNMFSKHDDEIAKMHKSMMYLESFDQVFFTSGIYQTKSKETQSYKKQY